MSDTKPLYSDEEVLNLAKTLENSLQHAVRNMDVNVIQLVDPSGNRLKAVRARYRDRYSSNYFDQVHMVDIVMAYIATVYSYEEYISKAVLEAVHSLAEIEFLP